MCTFSVTKKNVKRGTSMNGQEAYLIMGIQGNMPTKEELKRKYRELCKQLHPDDNPSREAVEQYLKVQQAYHWILEHQYYARDQVQKYVFQDMKEPARTGKIIGGWQTTEPTYTNQQYRQMMNKRMEEERRKKAREEEEKQRKIWEAMQKARKLPSEREAEKWKEIETRREAERIAALIQQLLSLEDLQ